MFSPRILNISFLLNIEYFFSFEYWIYLFSEYWIFHGRLVGRFMGSYPWLANSYPPYRTRTSLPSIGKWVPMQMLRPDYTNPCARPLYVQMYVQIMYVYIRIWPEVIASTPFIWSAIDGRTITEQIYGTHTPYSAITVFLPDKLKSRPIQTCRPH